MPFLNASLPNETKNPIKWKKWCFLVFLDVICFSTIISFCINFHFKHLTSQILTPLLIAFVINVILILSAWIGFYFEKPLCFIPYTILQILAVIGLLLSNIYICYVVSAFVSVVHEKHESHEMSSFMIKIGVSAFTVICLLGILKCYIIVGLINQYRNLRKSQKVTNEKMPMVQSHDLQRIALELKIDPNQQNQSELTTDLKEFLCVRKRKVHEL